MLVSFLFVAVLIALYLSKTFSLLVQLLDCVTSRENSQKTMWRLENE